MQGGEPERNIHGRVISFAKIKNKSKLTDCSGPERLIDNSSQPAAKINCL